MNLIGDDREKIVLKKLRLIIRFAFEIKNNQKPII